MEKAQENNYRYERKMLIEALDHDHVLSLISLHPFAFKEIYSERIVNSVYFDTADFRSYLDNVEGKEERLKARIRWYGDEKADIDLPTLELKIKKGLLGKKRSYKLPVVKNFDFKSSLDSAELPLFEKELLDRMKPLVYVRYLRRYFLSQCKRYRITIDSQISFSKFNPQGIKENPKEKAVILEVKYDQNSDLDADKVTSFFPFRVTKSSKYVMAIAAHYATPV